jgi:hypothetical protein
MINLGISFKAVKTRKLIISGACMALIIYKFLYFLLVCKMIRYTLKRGLMFRFLLIFPKNQC